jgi:hypothetical protein
MSDCPIFCSKSHDRSDEKATQKVVRWILLCFMWGHLNYCFLSTCMVLLIMLLIMQGDPFKDESKVKWKKAVRVYHSSIIMCVIQSGCLLCHLILHTHGLWFVGNLKMAASEQQWVKCVLLYAKFESSGGAMWVFFLIWLKSVLLHGWNWMTWTWLFSVTVKHSDIC